MNRYESLAILQLSESASWREVQSAYKHQLVKWHPDKFNGSNLMSSYSEEKCKVASEAFLSLKELYQQGVLPLRTVYTSSSSACGGACNTSDFNGLHQGMGHQGSAQGFEESHFGHSDCSPKVTNWKRNLFLGAKERACDVIGLILLPLEFAFCLLKVIVGNVAIFSLIFAPMLSGCVVMNALLSASERIEDVASAISVATMGSQCVSSGNEMQGGDAQVRYIKLKGHFFSMIHGTR